MDSISVGKSGVIILNSEINIYSIGITERKFDKAQFVLLRQTQSFLLTYIPLVRDQLNDIGEAVCNHLYTSFRVLLIVAFFPHA